MKYLPKLRKFLKRQDVDAIIDVDLVLDCLSVPAAAGLKTRVISWEHFNCQFEQSVPYRRWIVKYLVRRSDYVIALTKRDREQYARHLRRQERIQAICNPIEEPVPAPEIQRGMLEERIRAVHLEDRLILKGNVRNAADYLRRSQIYVMTSRYEGLAMCLLEAGAQGLPCVAFDVPTGTAELIADGTNGYLIPPFVCDEMEEKIGRIIEDGALWERFSQSANLGTEEYRPDFVLEQWNRVLAQLVPLF